MKNDCRHIETIMVHGSKSYDEKTGAISFPIYQSATFRHEGLNQSTGFDYSRTSNPTRDELEKTIAKLEGGTKGLAFSTGMAAIDNIARLFSPKDNIIVSDDLYGGTYRLFEEIYKIYGIETSYVDTTKVEDIEKHINSNTRAIFIETPSNPLMKISDIKAISTLGKKFGILTIVDNTFLTPYFQKPLDLGADIVVHSGTKFLGGHNDTLAGLIVVNREDLAEKLSFFQNSIGAVLSPFDSWLILRGIKTLALRLEKQQQNALTIANWLKTVDVIDKVYYPGLMEHEGHKLCLEQSKGFGSMISFTVKDSYIIPKVLEKVKIILFAESLGGVESLITYPFSQTHAAIPEEVREKLGVTNKLLRLSVGVENVDDLIKDLEEALTY
jgi:cystathionine gamma-synthase